MPVWSSLVFDVLSERSPDRALHRAGPRVPQWALARSAGKSSRIEPARWHSPSLPGETERSPLSGTNRKITVQQSCYSHCAW